MKKILFTLCAIVGLALITGCTKECNCQAVVNGEVKAETVVKPEKGEKCSDITHVDFSILGFSFETKCTPKLF